MSQRQTGFTTQQVTNITGATKHVLDNWHRAGVVSPSIATAPGHGGTRLYSFRDVIAVRVLMVLRSSGVSLASLRKVVSYLSKRKGLSPTDALARTSLVTDGHDVYEVEGDVMLSALRKPGQREFFVVLPFDELVNDVQKKALAQRAA